MALDKQNIAIFYLLLIIALSVYGYQIGLPSILSSGGPVEDGLNGALVGVVISMILWYAWGINNSY